MSNHMVLNSLKNIESIIKGRQFTKLTDEHNAGFFISIVPERKTSVDHITISITHIGNLMQLVSAIQAN